MAQEVNTRRMSSDEWRSLILAGKVKIIVMPHELQTDIKCWIALFIFIGAEHAIRPDHNLTVIPL